MKASQINLKKQGYFFSTNQYPKGSHVSTTLRLGKCLPSCKSQLKYYRCPDVLNMDDVEKIENLLKKYGYEGEYSYTKSKSWVRLQNVDDLLKVLKKEYGN